MRNQKLHVLLKNKRKIYHTADLAVLWGVPSMNSLYKAVSRFVEQKVLYPVQRGMYSTVPVDQLDPFELGVRAVHGYAYISTETVLLQHGVVFQNMQVITLVSARSQNFTLAGHSYRSRKLRDDYLFNASGITDRGDGVYIASIERAVSDLLYFAPKYHLDNSNNINWKAVKDIQKEVGYV